MTDSEYHNDRMRDEANVYGALDPDCCWYLTGYDVWVRNPHYRGPDQPHPEDDSAFDWD